MSAPLISVFLPTHARFKSGLFQKSVESVLAQSYKNFEFFIVDDASTDGTAEYSQKIAQQDKRVKHIRFDKNICLPARTLAQAYMESKGELLAFAFDDTEWLPHHLDTLVKCLEDNYSAAMVYGGVLVEPPGTAPILLGHNEFDLAKVDFDNYIGNSGVMLRRRTVDIIGWYDPHVLMKRVCDWDLWLRIGKTLPIAYCPKVVAAEKGVVQPDSLGMSVSRFDSLARKYQKYERNYLLSPSLIAADKTPMFDSFDWMTEEELKQLRILLFEHFMRTKNIREMIKVSRQWLSEAQGENTGQTEQEILTNAFNIYLSETRYACKNTCSSAFKLNDLTDAHNTLQIHHNTLKAMYDEILGNYRNLENQYNNLLNSLSWRITKPIRELNRIRSRN